jgi:phosphoribosylaminoimidazolecarboxamide formyltransferase/IMP cyclohydrolase
LVSARQLNGKELSYNNYLDLDAALGIVGSLPVPGAVVIKHTNPCGAASAETLSDATQAAMAGDPVSAFGSILGFNQPVDAATAELLAQPGLFVEAMIAPSFTEQALEVLTSKPKWKKNVRLMAVGNREPKRSGLAIRQVDGGILLQEADLTEDRPDTWRIVTEQEPATAAMDELSFAWALVRHVKSNAIVITNQRSLRGAGIGQTSRVDAVEHAIQKAGPHVTGAALASDAFFPFADSIERAAAAGIQAIIQPGGSKKDAEVIEACNRLGLSMVFTGQRHFKH